MEKLSSRWIIQSALLGSSDFFGGSGLQSAAALLAQIRESTAEVSRFSRGERKVVKRHNFVNWSTMAIAWLLAKFERSSRTEGNSEDEERANCW